MARHHDQSKDKIARVRQLRDLHFPFKVIAERVGLSITRVREICAADRLALPTKDHDNANS